MAIPYHERGTVVSTHSTRDWEISPSEVRRLLDVDQDLVLIDCRAEDEHEIARIEAARLIPLPALPERVEELSGLRTRRIVVFCHHGVRSLRATAFLRSRGFEAVFSMAGGIDAWSHRVDPSVPTY